MVEAAPRVLFYVQSLLGLGHLHRAAALAQAMARAGLARTVATGAGAAASRLFDPIRGVAVLPLPPIKARDASFALTTPEGRAVDAAYWARRRARLLDAATACPPAVVLTDLFPFGRRAFRRELLPLLEQIRADQPGTRILCSLRDILVASPAEKQAQGPYLVRRAV